jgi:carboxylesterase
MGALLAATLAASEEVAAVALLAPALQLQGQRLLALVGVAKYVLPYFYPLERANFADPQLRAIILDRSPGLDLDDPTVVAEIRRRVRYPLATLHELTLLQNQARRDLARISAPTLIVQGRADETVVPTSAAEAERRVGAPIKRVLWLDGAGHQLTSGADREQVFAAVTGWLGEHTG